MLSNVVSDVPNRLQTVVHHKGIPSFDSMRFAVRSLNPRFTLKDVAEFYLVVHRSSEDTCCAVPHTGFECAVGADKMTPNILLGRARNDILCKLFFGARGFKISKVHKFHREFLKWGFWGE